MHKMKYTNTFVTYKCTNTLGFLSTRKLMQRRDQFSVLLHFEDTDFDLIVFSKFLNHMLKNYIVYNYPFQSSNKINGKN